MPSTTSSIRKGSKLGGAPGSTDVASDVAVIGTYDGGLMGFRTGDGAQTFGYAPHAGCVKALACNRAGLLASGGTDNMVRIFDLARSMELGELQEHDDAVTCLDFWGSTNLVTGGADGQVLVWRCGDWEILLKFRAHKAAVTCVAVHPSGRLMASAGQDKALRLWDLTRGTSAAHIATEHVTEVLKWSPSADRVAALNPLELLVVGMKDCAKAAFRDPKSAGFMRVTLSAAMFLSDDRVLLGDGKGDLRVLAAKGSATGLAELCRLPAGGARTRVKALANEPSNTSSGLFIAGMSSGCVEIWRCAMQEIRGDTVDPGAFTRLHVVDTGARLTCLALWLAPGAPGAAAGEEAREAEAATAEPKPKKRRRAA
mmetsp:Transcript_28394/g.80223  ORF Transcript_28394/g.80223 Transcript_28394/m.80223 type:complete len:370 (+) Transcript_28394:82-1191(+)